MNNKKSIEQIYKEITKTDSKSGVIKAQAHVKDHVKFDKKGK